MQMATRHIGYNALNPLGFCMTAMDSECVSRQVKSFKGVGGFSLASSCVGTRS